MAARLCRCSIDWDIARPPTSAAQRSKELIVLSFFIAIHPAIPRDYYLGCHSEPGLGSTLRTGSQAVVEAEHLRRQHRAPHVCPPKATFVRTRVVRTLNPIIGHFLSAAYRELFPETPIPFTSIGSENHPTAIGWLGLAWVGLG